MLTAALLISLAGLCITVYRLRKLRRAVEGLIETMKRKGVA
jgi:hypothetical protein